MATRAPLVIPAAARHTATVILAHGLGDTGHGMTMLIENWRRRQRLDEVKFILPHAPVIPITVNMGYPMPGWYDIAELSADQDAMRRNEDEAGIVRSQKYIHSLVQKEIDDGIPSERIALAGFSQGGAMSIFSGLTATVKLAGIVAMSSYLVLSLRFADLVPKPEFNKNTPILMCHGDADPVVNFGFGKASFEAIKRMGYNASFSVYRGMGHTLYPEEMDEVEAFLSAQLPILGEASQQSSGKSEL